MSEFYHGPKHVCSILIKCHTDFYTILTRFWAKSEKNFTMSQNCNYVYPSLVCTGIDVRAADGEGQQGGEHTHLHIHADQPLIPFLSTERPVRLRL